MRPAPFQHRHAAKRQNAKTPMFMRCPADLPLSSTAQRGAPDGKTN